MGAASCRVSGTQEPTQWPRDILSETPPLAPAPSPPNPYPEEGHMTPDWRTLAQLASLDRP